MRKQFVKAMLFGALTFSTAVSFVGCKDYDDDIDNLWTAVNGKVTPEQLQTKVTELQSALDLAKTELQTVKANADAAKTAAEAAKTAAEKAATDATAAGDKAAAAKAAADAAQADATAAKNLATSEASKAQLAAIAEAEKKVKALKDELDPKVTALEAAVEALESAVNNKASQSSVTALQATVTALQSDLDALDTKADALSTMVSNLLGHRLTSVSLHPTQHINGIPAIVFDNLTYTALPVTPANEKDASQLGLLPTTAANLSNRSFVDNGTTEVQYLVSPRLGIRTQDIKQPYFDGFISTNTMTRAIKESNTGVNKPIAPIDGEFSIDSSKGLLTMKVKKNIVSTDELVQTYASLKETFYMVTLNVPVADASRSQEEIDGEINPIVASEAVRVGEAMTIPMIAQATKQGTMLTAHTKTADVVAALNATNSDGKFVHYHDSTALYTSAIDASIDHLAKWDTGLDLKPLVTGCKFMHLVQKADGTYEYQAADHSELTVAKLKEYGMEFRFAMASKAYELGDNDTDQQQFAYIENGVLKSQLYGDKVATRTALGRQPIIRITLVDTKNGNKIVARRYMKVCFAEIPDDIKLPEYVFGKDIISCENTERIFGTQEMNELFYRKIEEAAGLSKYTFHTIYPNVTASAVTKDGTVLTSTPVVVYKDLTLSEARAKTDDIVFALIKDQLDATTYNLFWSMSPKAVGTVLATDLGSKFSVTITFSSTNKNNGDVIKTFVQTIGLPVKPTFNYQDTYWGDVSKIFNLNPIQYKAAYYRDWTSITHSDIRMPFHETWTTGGGKTANGHNNAWGEFNAAGDILGGSSHIGTDLVNGFLSTAGVIPTSAHTFANGLAAYALCDSVSIIFDGSRLTANGLAGYQVSNGGRELWSGVPGANVTDKNLKTYAQAGKAKLGATINPIFTTSKATAQLWLAEASEDKGTEAAIGLIDKMVPVKIVVDYNGYNKVEFPFNVHVMNPLTVGNTLTDKFQDAVISGSYVNVRNGLNILDWEFYKVAPTAISNATEKQKYARELFDFYRIMEIKYLVGEAKTNLKQVGNVWTPTAGFKTGTMPVGSELVNVYYRNNSYQTTKEPSSLNHTAYYLDQITPAFLGYTYNYNGTPVNKEFEIYVDAEFNYKWGTPRYGLTIQVLPSDALAPTPTPVQ